MKRFHNILVTSLLLLVACRGPVQSQEPNKPNTAMKFKELTLEEQHVILNKGTERPYTGKYNEFFETGTYVCKQCGTPLYESATKFDGHCGWPAFDDEIPGAVRRVPDHDGRRTEILCAHCGGHLGHVFEGEGFTPKNTRHCVNSISLDFKPKGLETKPLQTAVFAAGCFWGVEYYFKKAKGVVKTTVGYTGGHKNKPTYQEVCNKTTGHYEAIEVVYDASQTDFETLAKLFFEIHDPTQTNGQGPDIGEQYLSVAFYASEAEKQTIQNLVATLQNKGLRVATLLKPIATFWPAEEIHQRYYDKTGKAPYCHAYTKRF